MQKINLKILLLPFIVEDEQIKVLVDSSNEKYSLISLSLKASESIEFMLEKFLSKNALSKFTEVFEEIGKDERTIYLSYFACVADNLNLERLSLNEKNKLSADENKVLAKAVEKLKQNIFEKETLKALFINGVTMPELQDVLEDFLKQKFDRRNFRKKMVAEDILIDSGDYRLYKGKKPAKIYYIK